MLRSYNVFERCLFIGRLLRIERVLVYHFWSRWHILVLSELLFLETKFIFVYFIFGWLLFQNLFSWWLLDRRWKRSSALASKRTFVVASELFKYWDATVNRCKYFLLYLHILVNFCQIIKQSIMCFVALTVPLIDNIHWIDYLESFILPGLLFFVPYTEVFNIFHST